MAHGKAFSPVKHQAMLAEDLANLPQFLCDSGDLVLTRKPPSTEFLQGVQEAGFPLPEFIELGGWRINPADSVWQRNLGALRPWAWGPDSVELLQPLFGCLTREARSADRSFHAGIARLYSKAWSAEFLRKVLAHFNGEEAVFPADAWLCPEEEAGVAVGTLDGALDAIDRIRRRGHRQVVVKEAHGVAGHNALRLWELEMLPSHRQWLARALRSGRRVVVEPWLERELDFSVQLEMGPRGIELCGYTGLVNDRKGQFLANWAEPGYDRWLPARVATSFRAPAEVPVRLLRIYGEIFSLLEAELERIGFAGPVSIDALVYRSSQGDVRLKPVVEINPRYTMGRLTVELMKHACPGSSGLFRLVSRRQAQAEGFADLAAYAHSLTERRPLRLEGKSAPKIRHGALCLNDPAQAQVCLATFQVAPVLDILDLPGGSERQRFRRA